jgi:hypothetical protein
MVLGVGKGLGLDVVTGKGTIHLSMQEINKEISNLDESPKKETQEKRRDETKCKRKQKKLKEIQEK